MSKNYLVEQEGTEAWSPFTMGFVKALQAQAPDVPHTVLAYRNGPYMMWDVQMPTLSNQAVIVSSLSTPFDNAYRLDPYQLFDQGYNLAKSTPSDRLKLAFDTLVSGGNVEAALNYESELASRRETGVPMLVRSLIKGAHDGSFN
jgi:hypothetical protein